MAQHEHRRQGEITALMSRLRLSVQTKILGLAGLLTVLLVVFGVVAITKLGAVERVGESMYADRVVPLKDLSESRALLGDIDSQIQRAITDQDPARHAGYADLSENDAKGIEQLIEKYEATLLVEDEKKGLVAYHRDWQAYQAAFRGVLSAAEAQDADKATRIYFAAAGPLYGKVDGDLKRLGQVNDREAKRLNADIAATADSARTAALVLLRDDDSADLGKGLRPWPRAT
jgi:methyl-accepting chemotaxis protein